MGKAKQYATPAIIANNRCHIARLYDARGFLDLAGTDIGLCSHYTQLPTSVAGYDFIATINRPDFRKPTPALVKGSGSVTTFMATTGANIARFVRRRD